MQQKGSCFHVVVLVAVVNEALIERRKDTRRKDKSATKTYIIIGLCLYN